MAISMNGLRHDARHPTAVTMLGNGIQRGTMGLRKLASTGHYIGLCRIRWISPRHLQWRLMRGGGENTSSSPGPACHRKLLNLWWIFHHQRVMYRGVLHNRWSLPATTANDFLCYLGEYFCDGYLRVIFATGRDEVKMRQFSNLSIFCQLTL